MSSFAVISIVPTREQANQLIAELKAAHFSDEAISVLFLDPEASRRFAYHMHTATPDGISSGIATGGVVGGIMGMAVGLASLTIPGAGLVLAAGPLYLALSGLGVGIAGAGGAVIGASVGGMVSSNADIGGASAGSIAGGLIRLGMTAADALEYEAKVLTGEVLVAVQAEGDAGSRQAAQVVAQSGGHDLLTLLLPTPERTTGPSLLDTAKIDLGTATRA